MANTAASTPDLTFELPSFKGVAGWEFTPIDKLDLDAFPAAAGDTQRGAGAEELSRDTPELETVAHPSFFVGRNAAEWTDGTLVRVPANTKADEPIRITTRHTQPGTALHHRTLVVLEEGAEAEVWDELSGGADGVVNGVVELIVGANATLRYVSVQDLDESAWVFGAQRAVVHKDGHLDWTALGLGSGNGKVFLETHLEERGAHAGVTGAYATRGRQHVDFDTLQVHAAPDTTSDLAFRGLLTGRSTAVWRGMIKVEHGAQRTDAFQEARNLLLGKKAHADAIPGLEILADDVRCTHAAAIAQVDPEQIYYLRSHGLPRTTAERLVVEGFLGALVERFPQGPRRDAIAELLERRLELVLG